MKFIHQTYNRSSPKSSASVPNIHHGRFQKPDEDRHRIDNNRRAHLLAWTSFFLVSTTTPAIHIMQAAHAACLQGDTSVDCIGVYKLPLDDEILPFIDSPEHVAQYAPDLRYVPPTPIPSSPKEAWNDLIHIHSMIQKDIRSCIIKGTLTDAGTLLLYILPKVAMDAKVILQSWNSDDPIQTKNTANENKDRFQSTLEQVMYNMNQLDVMIGQALRGELGALTPAQIQLLSILKDLDLSYQDMMRLIPSLNP